MKGNLILLTISLIIALALVEMGLRITGRYATYTERTDTGSYVSPFQVGYGESWYRVHAPNQKIAYQNKEFSASWITNNEGFDDKTFSVTKQGKRIMVLGDSFTEGSGAPNDSSYPRQLADIIKDSVDAPVEVWNCGVGGSDLFYEFVLFRDKLLKYKPDMAVVTINNTDIYETMIRGGFERFGKDRKTHYKKGPWFEPLFEHSYVVRAIAIDAFGYGFSFIKKSEDQQLRETAMDELCIAMDSFSVLCKEKNIALSFAFHPMQSEMESRDKYFAVKQIAHCGKLGYDYVDAREQFYKMGIDADSAKKLYWSIDGHFNPTGYHYLAWCVWENIKEKIKQYQLSDRGIRNG